MYLANGKYDLNFSTLAPHVSVEMKSLSSSHGTCPIILERRSTLERLRRLQDPATSIRCLGYVRPPRQDKRGVLRTAEVLMDGLAYLRFKSASETLRDYFYVADRHGNWDASGPCIRFYKLRRLLRPPSFDCLQNCEIWKCRASRARRTNAAHSRSV